MLDLRRGRYCMTAAIMIVISVISNKSISLRQSEKNSNTSLMLPHNEVFFFIHEILNYIMNCCYYC